MKLRLNASSVVVGLAIGALTAGGITYAAASAGGTTINACQSKSTGALRVLTSGTCKATEILISWGSQGPQGDQGVQGAQGLQGLQGERGPATYSDSVDAAVAASSIPGTWVTGGDVSCKTVEVPAHQQILVHRVAAISTNAYASLAEGPAALTARLIQDSDSGVAAYVMPGVEDMALGRAEGVSNRVQFCPTNNGMVNVQWAVRLAYLP